MQHSFKCINNVFSTLNKHKKWVTEKTASTHTSQKQTTPNRCKKPVLVKGVAPLVTKRRGTVSYGSLPFKYISPD